MAGDALGAAISSAADRISKLHSSFLELEGLRGPQGVDWSDLEREFSEREASLKQRYEELLKQELRLDSETRQVMDRIREREALVCEREEALLQHHHQDPSSKEIQPMETDIAEQQHLPTKQAEAKAAEPPTSTTPTRSVERSQVKVRPYLKTLCENMDGEGLRRYIVDHRKDMGALRGEMPVALQLHASDPARLVLDAVEGYHDQSGGEFVAGKNGGGVANSANRRACLLLLEALTCVLGDEPVVASDIKFLVRKVAEQWKSSLDLEEGSSSDGNSLDAQAFLQLVAAYGLSSEYDEEELCKLVLAVTRRKQTPALCKSLKLSHKIPEILEHLTNDGKQIEALAFAHTFDMMGRIEPVPLLKAYLKDARKNVQNKGGGNQAQNDNVTKELAAVRNVIKCIEDYHLESEYPSSPLHRRVALLEKTRSERKRTGGSVKGQAKRARNAGYERSFYRQSSENNNNMNNNMINNKPQLFNNQISVPAYTLQTPFDARAPAAYATFSPAAAAGAPPDARSRAPYLYSVDGSIYGSPELFTQPGAYTSFQLAPGLPPPAAVYQASFMH